jgi:hypothetical protein
VFTRLGGHRVTGALNITPFSHDDSLVFGPIACREPVPGAWTSSATCRTLAELVKLSA